MRRVTAHVEINGHWHDLTFLTTNFEWAASTIAELYKARWQVEILFKELKQTLQLQDFFGENENAVKWQIERNRFIDCRAIIDVREMFKYNDNATASGIFSRMAPIRENTVIYTKSEKAVKRQNFDPRIASGFRVFDCAK